MHGGQAWCYECSFAQCWETTSFPQLQVDEVFWAFRISCIVLTFLSTLGEYCSFLSFSFSFMSLFSFNFYCLCLFNSLCLFVFFSHIKDNMRFKRGGGFYLFVFLHGILCDVVCFGFYCICVFMWIAQLLIEGNKWKGM